VKKRALCRLAGLVSADDSQLQTLTSCVVCVDSVALFCMSCCGARGLIWLLGLLTCAVLGGVRALLEKPLAVAA
jgi:hypothetical protein